MKSLKFPVRGPFVRNAALLTFGAAALLPGTLAMTTLTGCGAGGTNVAPLNADGMGTRSQRYAMIVKDGKVEQLLVEPGPGLNASSAPIASLLISPISSPPACLKLLLLRRLS